MTSSKIDQESNKEKELKVQSKTDKTHDVSSVDDFEKPVFGLRHFFKYVLSRFLSDAMLQRSSALTVTSLLSGIPLFAVCFAVFTSFGIFYELKHKLQDFVFANFIPKVANSLQQYIDVFITQNKTLTVLGIIFLVITAIMLLMTISDTFNVVWKVRQAKSALARFLVYWAILTLAPILFGASVIISSYLFTVATPGDLYHTIVQNISFVIPFILQVIGFTILYLVIPHFPVQRRDALLGGIFTGFFFEVLKELFVIYLTLFPPLQNIYTILAIFPISLLLVYLGWAVILFGAELTASLPEWRSVSKNKAFSPFVLSPKQRFSATLAILHVLLKATFTGKGYTNREILQETDLTPASLVYATKELEKLRFITRADNGFWLLTRELKGMTLYDLFVQLELDLSSSSFAYPIIDGWYKKFNNIVEETEKNIKNVMNIDIKELLWDDEIEKYLSSLNKEK